MLDFDGVVSAWNEAEVHDIHPLRRRGMDPAAYWDCGAAQALAAAEHIKPEGTVLDFGCGDGRLAIPLAELGFRVIAADASPRMIERLGIVAAQKGTRLESLVTNGDDLKKKFPRRKVDAVICRAVLIHHDYEGVTRIVKNLAGAMKKGAVLIADWPSGIPQERNTPFEVTVWDREHRALVAKEAGLVPSYTDGDPGVWVKA